MNADRDKEASEFERTEDKLFSWGYACWETARVNNLPISTGLRSAIFQDSSQTKKHRRKPVKKGDNPPPVMEKCKQTKSFVTPKHGLSGENLTIDKIISRLANWQKKCIFRTYMWGQPDRKAAMEMKMRVGEYSRRRRAAVEEVANQLKRKYISGISSREL